MGALTRAAGLSLMLCVGNAARQAHAQESQCPDLTGTYEPRSTEWIDKFRVASLPRPKAQAPQFATFRRSEDGYTLTWHMTREAVLAAARLQAERDPRKYGIWLDMTLRDPRTPLLKVSEEAWSNRLANYGPVFRVDSIMPLKQCKDGWFLLTAGPRAGAADIEGGMDGTRDFELWLGRDKDGALSLKWKEYRTFVVIQQTRYSSTFGVPLWWSTHLDKWPAAPAPDLSPIRAEELPEARATPRRIH